MFSIRTDLRAIGGAKFIKDKPPIKYVINSLATGLNLKEANELLFRSMSMWKEGEHSSILHFIYRVRDITSHVRNLEDIRARMYEDDSSTRGRLITLATIIMVRVVVAVIRKNREEDGLVRGSIFCTIALSIMVHITSKTFLPHLSTSRRSSRKNASKTQDGAPGRCFREG